MTVEWKGKGVVGMWGGGGEAELSPGGLKASFCDWGFLNVQDKKDETPLVKYSHCSLGPGGLQTEDKKL